MNSSVIQESLVNEDAGDEVTQKDIDDDAGSNNDGAESRLHEEGMTPVPEQINPAFTISGTYHAPKKSHRMDGEPLIRLNLSKTYGCIFYGSIYVCFIILPNVGDEKQQAKCLEIIRYIMIAIISMRLLVVPLRFTPPHSFSVEMFKGKRKQNDSSDGKQNGNLITNSNAIEVTEDTKSFVTSQVSSSNNNEEHNREASRPTLHWMSNIKSLMMLLVVAAHSATSFAGFFAGAYRNSFSTTVSVLIFTLYPIAMPIFFFLSGYVMLPSLQRVGRRRLLNRRSLRLTPVFLWYYLICYPLYEYVVAITLLPPMFHTYIEFEPSIGPAWFVGLLMLFNMAFVTVIDGWHPNRETDNKISNALEKNCDEERIGILTERTERRDSSNTDDNLSVIPVRRCFFVSAIVGAIEGVRRIYTPKFVMSGTGNISFFVLMFVGGCIFQYKGYISTPQGHGILTRKQWKISLLLSVSGVIAICLALIHDTMNDNAAHIIIPFKNKCGDSEIIIGSANPSNRMNDTKNDSLVVILSVVLFIILGVLMTSAILLLLDLAKRNFDWTNPLLSMLDRCTYGIYALHLLFPMFLFPAFIQILLSAGVINEELAFNAYGLSPSCIGDSEVFIWLGFFFVFTLSYVGSVLLVLCLLKVPGIRQML